jgi:excisionase family DNA binding protein
VKIPFAESRAKILAQHLERNAYVYVRQSTPHQVQHNQESGRMQYDLVQWAQHLGWPKERIRVLDEDQGQSSSTPRTRSDFAELIAGVARSDAGVVIGLEISRLARNSPDWANLMYLCRWTATLVADETGVWDPARPTDRMVLGLRGQLAELELDTSIHRMVEARLNKARRGELITLAPAGYDVDEEGMLVLTSDERVATAIRTVFQKFDELGSARQVYVFLREQSLLLPSRCKELRSHPVVWVKPSSKRVAGILHHPIYAGAYVFGRTETVRQVDAGTPPRVVVRRVKRDQAPVLLVGHHAAYISFDKFVENQDRLMGNRTSRVETRSGAAREGRALLAGLTRCGRCGRRMYTAYAGRSPAWPKGSLTYECFRGGDRDAKRCQSVAGKRVDEAVVQAFLTVTAPAGVEAAILAVEQLGKDSREVERLWRLQVEQAEYEAQRAQRQYDAVEPENRIVARELERRWNQRLVEQEEARRTADQKCAEHRPLTQAEEEEARRLGEDLPAVWHATTTTPRDRKRLLRCLIEEVQLVTEPDRYRVRIVWKGGEVTDCEVRRQAKGEGNRTPEETVELVHRLAAEFDDAQIARILNKQGRRSGSGRPFTKEAVRCIRRDREIPKCPRQAVRDPREGPFTADEVAAQLGVATSTIHRWLSEGVLPGTQLTAGAPWRIALTDDLRRRLAVGEAPDGWVGLTEAARRLGLSKPHVAYLVKTGKLPATRTKVGKRACWRIDISSTTCGRQKDLFDQVSSEPVEEA